MLACHSPSVYVCVLIYERERLRERKREMCVRWRVAAEEKEEEEGRGGVEDVAYAMSFVSFSGSFLFFYGAFCMRAGAAGKAGARLCVCLLLSCVGISLFLVYMCTNISCSVSGNFFELGD